MSERPPRVRPAFRRLAIVAFAILLPIAAHHLWDYLEVRRLVREIERLQQKGEPVNEREAARVVAPLAGQELDAASYYMAGGILALSSSPSRAIAPVREWLASPHPDRQAIDRLATPLHDLVQQSQQPLQLADAAARLPYSTFPAGTDYSYRTAGIGDLSQVIAARTLSASLAGRGDDAIESVISGLKIRRALRDARWLSHEGDHIDAVLSLSQPSSDALGRLQSALDAEEAPTAALDVLLRERARYLDMAWRRYYGTDPAAPRFLRWPMRSVTETVLRPWLTHDLIDTLRVWADLIEMARSPSPPSGEMRAAVAAQYGANGDTRPRTFLGIGAGRVLAVRIFNRATDPTPLIVDRCARVAVAVERYRRDHHGALPGDLSQLTPRYLASVPVDPYARAPLLFRVSADSYTIYSVGANNKDDGGDLTSELQRTIERGWGRRIIRGADVGIRVLVSDQHAR